MKNESPVVLLVDDDPGDLLIITDALEATGKSRAIHVARDGQEALDFLRREGEHSAAPRPDMILLDLNMPRMDGREALAVIKADDQLRSIPVVVLTTSNAPEDILISYRHHANAFVTKPLELTELMDAVRQIDIFYTSVAQLPPREPDGLTVQKVP